MQFRSIGRAFLASVVQTQSVRSSQLLSNTWSVLHILTNHLNDWQLQRNYDVASLVGLCRDGTRVSAERPESEQRDGWGRAGAGQVPSRCQARAWHLPGTY